jgi:hypothetical protein
MYPSALPIPHPRDGAYPNWRGVLVNVHGRTLWSCEHAHYFDSTAQDCAEYEKQKRLRGR